MCDFNYTGATCAGQLQVGKGPHVAASFNQAVTQQLALGADTTVNLEQNVAQSSYGLKYGRDGWFCTGLYNNGTMQAREAQYVRRVVPNRVTLATTLTAPLAKPGQAQFLLGSEFQLKQSRFNATVDGTGKIDVTLECQLLPTLSLTLTGQLNHAEDKHRFGYGVHWQLG
ncbi:unnamed protein product [Phaeothamnion confervicola]